MLKDDLNPYKSYLLMNYVAGMTLLKIENNNVSEPEVQEAGIRAMLEGYQSVKKDYQVKFLEKLQRIEQKGKLTKWIRKNMKEYKASEKTKILPKG